MSSAAQTHEFQTETKQLLDLMIHSLYSNKEIFLRELISNASDALDKRRFAGVTSPELLPDDELHIFVATDAEARTLTITDNGIGMDRQEVVDNIGTIAKSGTREFLEALREGKQKDEVPPELIGQFGVGFYSSFLVSDRVVLETCKAGEDTATRWESAGDGTYTLTDGERPVAGTRITLHLKPIDESDGIEDYTASWVVERLVRRYSDFVSYPIRMNVERKEPVLGADGKPVEGALPKIITEEKTLNSMKAIWTRSPDEVTAEEYKEFYKHISHDWTDPLEQIATQIEGNFEARALLFIPARAPFDLYHRDTARRGIQLYVKRVFVMDECQDLVPEYLRFIKGVVDAEGLSLNVSREMLQQDRQIRAIRKHLVRKILDSLGSLLRDNRSGYSQFWNEFGPALKEGLLEQGDKHERLLDLVLCPSTRESDDGDGQTTLAEYVERMGEDQQAVYFITAPAIDAARSSPHLEAFNDRGVEVLLFTDRIDEVWLRLGWTYKDKPFQSVGQGEVELGSAAEKEKAGEERKAKEERFADLLAALRAAVQDDIKEVRLSNRLTSSASCLVTEEGGITPQMELLMRQSGQELPKIKRILELNPNHELLDKLDVIRQADPKDPRVTSFAQLLYGQAVLAEGGQLVDPAAFVKLVAAVMTQAV